MKRINLEQGSPEWLEWRRGKRMASETAAVMGISPYSTAAQVRAAKQGRDKTFTNAAMQRGHDEEPKARAAFEEFSGVLYQPAVFEDGEYGASVDGITMEGDQLLEIKTPWKGKESDRWGDVADGGISDYDYCQVQHQMMVTGAADCVFLVWDGEEYVSTVVPANPEFWDRIRAAWDDFWPTVAEREDDDWAEAAEFYRKAKESADIAAAQLQTAKDRLIELTAGNYSGGCGVGVTKITKVGTVDWKKVHADLIPDADVEQYRKPGSEFFKVEIKA